MDGTAPWFVSRTSQSGTLNPLIYNSGDIYQAARAAETTFGELEDGADAIYARPDWISTSLRGYHGTEVIAIAGRLR
jgi:hypothetical protein